MANITAGDVNKLRQMTGAGMMDCKNALVECDGDFDQAVDHLRKKGQKIASKRADRDANEGIVLGKVSKDETFASIIMLNCETDFVAKNQEFIDFAKKVSDITIEKQPKSLDELNEIMIDGFSIAENIMNMIGKIGEKLSLSRYEFITSEKVFSYNHQGNRLATIVGFNKSESPNLADIGHEIAMQIAAMAPVALDEESVDQKTIENELEVGREQARLDGKPENMIEKIAEGKLKKFFKDSTLLNQDFVRDTKKSVGQFIVELDKDLKVNSFKRLMLGA
ncbi:MAG: translation elongation factor Ts [Bacteroidota bacterium]